MSDRVGIMGGTFDPIHHGHLFAAEEARQSFSLDRVLFVPAGRPWQKADRAVTDAKHRLAMTSLAVESNDAFALSSVDVDRGGPTYAVDTLRDIAAAEPGAALYFITGADAILDILTWKDPEVLMGMATFVAVNRPGHDLTDLGTLDVPATIERLEIPALAISSTDIRRRVAASRSIRYLVPDAVATYIADHRLYAA